MPILNCGGNAGGDGGLRITAENGYYTMSDGGNVSITVGLEYCTISWS